jgi:hypothetical protein
MMGTDCYFFIDANTPEDEQTMSVMCTDCRDTKAPEIGWFYRGSVEGYGPFPIECDLCGLIIHKAEDDNEDQEEVKTSG